MLSIKRLMYVILIVAVVSGVFMIYNINEERAKSIQIKNPPAEARKFLEPRPEDGGERPGVWLLGSGGDELYGDIYRNVLRFF